jgi:hypothetical protein
LKALLIAAGMIFCAGCADFQLHAVRQKQDVAVSHGERLATKLVALAESCSVNSTAYAVSGDTWAQALASDSFVHVVFPELRRVRLESRDNHSREERSIREVLLPLPEGSWPKHVFVRSGTDTLAFTNYDPLALQEVVLEEELRLLTVPPYEYLLRTREGDSHER